jgi:hypothetical protein
MAAWEFISDPDNQKTLAWLGGGIIVAVSGLWAAFLQARKPPASPSAAKPANAISAGDGISAIGNVRVDGNLAITKTQIPKAAYALAALGLLVIGWGFTLAGNSCTSGSVVTGGNVTDSKIEINGQTPAVDC